MVVVDRYMDAFSVGMKNRWPHRVYIDLMSGPGRCIARATPQEFDGSPVLSLNPRYPFADVWFNDGDPIATQALTARIGRLEPNAATHLSTLDCSDAARLAGSSLFTPSTLGMAFIDPTGFQIDFDAIAEMTRGRRIDLIITMMTGYLKRFLLQPDMENRLDGFFGEPAWRTTLRKAGKPVSSREILDYFAGRLKLIGYDYVDDDVRVTNSRNSTMYHLVFASKNAFGPELFRRVCAKRPESQIKLL